MRVILAILILSSIFFGCKPKPPEAKFDFEIGTGGKVTFTNLSSGLIDEYLWSFGDGKTSLQVSPTHYFRVTGTFAVSLTVKNERGEDTFSKDVEIDYAGLEQLNGHPIFKDMDGILYAIINQRTLKDDVSEYQAKFGEAIASFLDTGGYFVKVGSISLSGNQLNLNTDNSYSYDAWSISETDTTNYWKEVNWSVSGGSGYKTILQSVDSGFPNIAPLLATNTGAGIDDISRSKDYVVATLSPIENAKFILYQILDDQNNVLLSKTTQGDTTSWVFPKSELTSISSGSGYVSITGYSYFRKVIKGKVIYFVNESRTQREVTIK